MDIQQQHFNRVTGEIRDKIHEMAGQYDAKILAVMLVTQGADLLQMLTSLGVMDPAETRRTVAEATKNVCVPLDEDELPELRTLNKPPRLS